MVGWLGPLAGLYNAITGVRNQAYEHGLFKVKTVNVPVISVGNLTAGGTGKTPLISWLVSEIRKSGIKVGIVSRGYKRKSVGIQRVDPDRREGAKYYGDEPFLLAQLHPEVPIYVGADRVAAAERLLAEEGPQIIFADDAFQHRRLFRNIDVVVFDSTEELGHYRLLPEGRLRESLKNLKRADFLVFSKSNLASSSRKSALVDLLRPHAGEILDDPSRSLFFEYRIDGLKSSEGVNFEGTLSGEKVLLVSGIGNPGSFKKLVEAALKVTVQSHMVFADHFEYGQSEVSRIVAEAKRHEASRIITTEKDMVKLQQCALPQGLFWATQLRVSCVNTPQNLLERVLQLVGDKN